MPNDNRRILITHTGSLPRPEPILDLLSARSLNTPESAPILGQSVAEVVRQQADCGVDIVSDAELGKTGFFGYVTSRLSGFESVVSEPRPSERTIDTDPSFPEFGNWLRARTGEPSAQAARPARRTVCTGPIAYSGQRLLETDIGNLKAALAAVGISTGFMTAASVGLVSRRMDNRHYATYEQYVQAIAEAMRHEYRAIADAGLVLQIDAPELAIDRNHYEFRDRPLEYFRSRLELWVEALNYALEGLPEDRLRMHLCWGNSEAPHTNDVPLADIIDIVFKAKVRAYSIEASKPRHAHEWRLWQTLELPDGKQLIPGVIDTTTNFVEHPRLVADRVLTYARLVGRDNVIAGTDCGFGTAATQQAVYTPIVWAKLKALSEGAAIASSELWP